MKPKHTPQRLFYRGIDSPHYELRFSHSTESCFTMHSHQEYSIGLLTQGESQFQSSGTISNYTTGQVCTINANTFHRCHPKAGTGWSYWMLYVSQIFLEQTLYDQKILTLNQQPCFQHNLQNSTQLYNAWLQLFTQHAIDSAIFEAELKKHIITTYIFDQQHNNKQPRSTSSSKTQNDLEALLSWLHKHFQQPINDQTLATQLNCSVQTLRKRFKSRYCLSPNHYINLLRVQHAQGLLRQGESICASALSAGFSDQSHLYRWFRKFVDATPQQYQQAYSSIPTVPDQTQ